MSDLPERISLREVGPRDGLQNEAPVPTTSKVALIDALSRTGVGRIEAVSFVHPKAIPSMADAAEVWAGITKAPGVRYSALVPNLVGARRALAAGCTELEVVISASETHNRANVNRTVEESLAGGQHRQVAARLGARLRSQDGAARTADEVEAGWSDDLPSLHRPGVGGPGAVEVTA